MSKTPLHFMHTLGLFVKQPIPGQVKTRLAADLGGDRAAALYAAFTGDVVDRFRTTADRRFLCHAPDTAAARAHFSQLAADDYQLWPQPDGTLGERMARFFADEFERGAERVVVIGSDSPTLPAALVDEAFDRLNDCDCVLGPATDGGYYLIGQKENSRPIFNDVDWSQPSVLRQTIERIESASARPALLTPWYDVDTTDDLEFLRGHLRAMRAAGHSIRLPRTESYLD